MQKKTRENLLNSYFYTFDAWNGCQVLSGSHYIVWFCKMDDKV